MSSPARTSIFRTPVAPHRKEPSPFGLPAVKTVLLFAAGILLNHYLPVPLPAVYLLPVILLLLGTALYRTVRSAAAVMIMLLVISAGYTNLQRTRGPFPPEHIGRRDMAGDTCLLLEISDMPEQRGSRIRFRANVLAVREKGDRTPATGTVLVTLEENTGAPAYGDIIRVQGELSRPPRALNPGQFDYRQWLSRQGVTYLVTVKKGRDIRLLEQTGGNPLLKYAVYPLKRNIISLLHRHLAPDAAALLQGMLLGMRSGIDRETMTEFSTAGVIHLLAVSGLHVGLVLAVFFFLFRLLRFPYRATIIGPMIMLVFYMVLTGMKPSVVRATIMAISILAGRLMERDGRIHNTIAVAALIILAIWPQALFDIGFQLSFAATLGIIVLYNQIMEWYPAALQKPDSKVIKYFVGAFTVSLAAQLGTAPFTAYYFNKISFISLGVNLLAVPLAFVIICTGFVLLPVAAVLPGAAVVPATVINWLVRLLTVIVKFSAGLPGAAMTIGSPSVISVVCCLLLTIFLVYTRQSVRMRAAALICVLVWANTVTWSRVIDGTDKKMTATFLAADDGAAALLEFPDRTRLLINSGGVSGKFDRAERLIRPYLVHSGVRSIDRFIATSLDENHIGGAAALIKDFGTGILYDTGHRYKSRQYLVYARQNGTLRRTLTAGDRLGMGGATITCLHPDTSFIKRYGFIPYGNDHVSMVLRIEYQDKRMLYYDCSTPLKDQEVKRLSTQLKSDILYCQGALPDHAVLKLIDPEEIIRGGDPGQIKDRSKPRTINLSENGAVIITISSGQIRMISDIFLNSI